MKRTIESDEQRAERLRKNAEERVDDAAATDKAADEMVRTSIRLHGA